jgi:hypothetical protein
VVAARWGDGWWVGDGVFGGGGGGECDVRPCGGGGWMGGKMVGGRGVDIML